MKYGEELKFLGGLYDAVRSTYSTADSLIQFEKKIDIAVEKYYGNEHIFFGINMAHYNADTLLINAII